MVVVQSFHWFHSSNHNKHLQQRLKNKQSEHTRRSIANMPKVQSCGFSDLKTPHPDLTHCLGPQYRTREEEEAQVAAQVQEQVPRYVNDGHAGENVAL